jgi:hypothetical protein
MFKNDTLTITIVNNTKTALPWAAFGYNQGLQSGPGVSVNVAESSLMQATRQSAQAYFDVKEIKIRTNNNEQLSNPITLQHSDATGKYVQVSFNPVDYVDVINSIPNFVVIRDPELTITGKDGITGVINANSRMDVIIKVKQATKKSNFIKSIIDVFAPGTNLTLTRVPK